MMKKIIEKRKEQSNWKLFVSAWRISGACPATALWAVECVLAGAVCLGQTADRL